MYLQNVRVVLIYILLTTTTITTQNKEKLKLKVMLHKRNSYALIYIKIVAKKKHCRRMQITAVDVRDATCDVW